MGVSTDGQICFGLLCEEGTEFPWEDDAYDYDIEIWWRVVNGYDGPEYPEEGWYEEMKKWDKANPCPAEMVNYCSADCDMYILAVPSTCMTANRGCPEKFSPENLKVSVEEAEALCALVQKYNIDTEEYTAWWLSSYWG